MSIVVKGSNDVLIFHCKIEDEFDGFLKELDELLDRPLFIQDGYFPKAFFHFGCRYLNEKEIANLIKLLFVKKRVLFYGVNLRKRNQKFVQINNQMIRSGEVIKVFDETLFINGLNKGGIIYTTKNLYFLGSVKGKIIGLHENIKIYGHCFENAQIQIMKHTLHDLTTYANVLIYDNNETIVVNKEEKTWQESLL